MMSDGMEMLFHGRWIKNSDEYSEVHTQSGLVDYAGVRACRGDKLPNLNRLFSYFQISPSVH